MTDGGMKYQERPFIPPNEEAEKTTEPATELPVYDPLEKLQVAQDELVRAEDPNLTLLEGLLDGRIIVLYFRLWDSANAICDIIDSLTISINEKIRAIAAMEKSLMELDMEHWESSRFIIQARRFRIGLREPEWEELCSKAGVIVNSRDVHKLIGLDSNRTAERARVCIKDKNDIRQGKGKYITGIERRGMQIWLPMPYIVGAELAALKDYEKIINNEADVIIGKR
jgi:hypothetical protein